MYSYNLGYLNKINGKVFKLFTVKQKLGDSSSQGTIMFDVLHYKEVNSNNDFLKKTYFLNQTKNNITFLDCNTNEIVNCKCFLTNENDNITVYFEPWHTSAQTIVNITYCNNLSLFNFNILGKCDIEKNTITNIIYSGSNDDIVEDYDIRYLISLTDTAKKLTDDPLLNPNGENYYEMFLFELSCNNRMGMGI